MARRSCSFVRTTSWPLSTIRENARLAYRRVYPKTRSLAEASARMALSLSDGLSKAIRHQ